ncbi:hypothetical protein JIN85_12335 [Luteolibacter pohnpeiensis]|uniref:Secreted protein n=1 Tax=Luteolibacter pohnpeiensis TaxID=454153 RepID=A0A934VRH3_9BACT|nr:hypothetical protein [Luteolibacter pohnpeiensis]MBK1883206.1 hypothetical protein [Luteolibacter pohnpeiensis]
MKLRIYGLAVVMGCFLAPASVRAESSDAMIHSDDPFAESPAKNVESRRNETRQAFQLRLEVWEMNAKQFVRQLDRMEQGADFAGWRRELLKDDSVSLVQVYAMSATEKSENTSSSLLELLYPTEHESVEIPRKSKPSPGDQGEAVKKSPLDWVMAPKDFECRSLGTTFEAEVKGESAETGVWRLRVSMDETRLTGYTKFGGKEFAMKMPEFSDFRAGGLICLPEGQWCLLTAQPTPPKLKHESLDKVRLVLVRLDRLR